MDERRRAMDLENLRHLEMLEKSDCIEPRVDYPWVGDRLRPRRAWQVAMLLLFRIARAGPVAQSVGRCLEVKGPMSLRYVRESRVLDEESDIGIDDYLVDWVAGELWISLDAARDQIVQLACDCRLLPPRIVDVVYAYVPWAERVPLASLTWFLSDARLIDRLALAGFAADAHFDRIRRKGRRAEARLMQINRSLVDSIVEEYVGRGVDRQRLMRAGADALYQAAAEFDPRRGFAFGDCAVHCIHDAMNRTVAETEAAARAGPLARVAEDIVDILRQRRLLHGELGREPTVEQIAEATGLSVDRIMEVREFPSIQAMPAFDVGNLGDVVFDTLC